LRRIFTATPFCPLCAFAISLTHRTMTRSQHASENDFEALEIDVSEIGIVPSLRHGVFFCIAAPRHRRVRLFVKPNRMNNHIVDLSLSLSLSLSLPLSASAVAHAGHSVLPTVHEGIKEGGVPPKEIVDSGQRGIGRAYTAAAAGVNDVVGEGGGRCHSLPRGRCRRWPLQRRGRRRGAPPVQAQERRVGAIPWVPPPD
jgi:hypothetical protein